MDLIDKLREIAARIPKQKELIQTEEATKSALVMPFLSALGYNVFDPGEVTPELNADIGLKKGEKVDYAILRDGKPVILIECKHHSTDLAKTHASQLYRYFSTTEARFGVLTNGIVYQFYSDLDAANKMDNRPFFEFSMMDIREQTVEELKKFSKSAFDPASILTTASELKYTREIRRILLEEFQSPSEELVKLIVVRTYDGRKTAAVLDQFKALTKRAFTQFINDQVNDRLKSALEVTGIPSSGVAETPALKADTGTASEPDKESVDVVTTVEELEAYYIVRSILRGSVDLKRLSMHDVRSYCGIILDGNRFKAVCRFYFNRSQKYLAVIDQQTETRIAITEIDDIYQYADRLREIAMSYGLPEVKGKKANS